MLVIFLLDATDCEFYPLGRFFFYVCISILDFSSEIWLTNLKTFWFFWFLFLNFINMDQSSI